ncbi:leucyl/phenylalanyl-tRNA--protein transferase [Parashewanella spongiae]|uniref:Leucyl/phenylalanyl-tRNA--protein transferase n=1 Tax=Parashewanella spongiae TaxID=342950 RepID=A0A3A6U3Q4_9GAMM|nr:leucyl/phenylalanyl-tRNA--protein transferase [Parashewanella spongiae]MCL1077229.1 leucyl/phenylalanyl-tRNA--protein transferase [Parashewanella spongiae]RJY18692.1 leucyl/phenylalanyl-tRNA--protein transferase [Parashewanella spongiae]
MNSLTFLSDTNQPFPDTSLALDEPNGLLAIGGSLSTERLLSAYWNGIFPWFNQEDPVLWWSPDPRAVIIPGQLHISRSLSKFIRKSLWTISINKSFSQVIKQCAKLREKHQGTWITDEIQQAYINLHEIGQAHSLEVWEGEELIGGLYGVSVGRVFCGESMFHTRTNASKVAMYELDKHLQSNNFALIDVQLMNPHLKSLGAKTINRNHFIKLLSQLKSLHPNNNCWQPKILDE